MKFKKGFTLLELLMVVGITTVLSGIGISSYINQQRAKLLDTSVQEVVGYLHYAQQKAMSQEEGSQWGVHFENPASGNDFYSLYIGSSYEALEKTHNLVKKSEYKIPSIFYPSYAFARYISSRETRYLPNGIEFGTPGDNETIDISFNKLIGDSIGGRIVVCGYSNQCVSITILSGGLIVYGEGDMVTGYAWNSRSGWVNFGYSGGNVFVPEGTGDLSGFAHSNNIGWISLNCVSTNSCTTVDYKISSDASGNLSGWAWSENYGWISFNCSNDNSCASSNYKVTVNQTTGDFDGYAWSQNLGWISFNCITGGPGQTNICSTSDYKVQKL